MHPLPIFLEAAVPLNILEIQRDGGPTEQDFERCRQFSAELGAHGDILLYKSKKTGETARIANQLARAVAVLAFVPGGVTLFGLHFEAQE